MAEEKKLSLDDQLKELGLSANAAVDDAKETISHARRVKKNSKDLAEVLGEIKGKLDNIAGAASVWQGLGAFGAGVRRERRNSKELDSELREAFQKLDTDGSGTLELHEIKAALQKLDPDAGDAEVEKLVAWADKDGNGLIDFDEYKAIMNYKSAVEAASAPVATA